jgi:hypothetical protein
MFAMIIRKTDPRQDKPPSRFLVVSNTGKIGKTFYKKDLMSKQVEPKFMFLVKIQPLQSIGCE